jgi:hypothetical protein
MPKSSKVRLVALQVRKYLEELLKDGIIDVSPNMCGACAIGSVKLTEVLKREGFKNAKAIVGYADKSKYGMAHCWVELNGKIIDITATQFNLPKVFIRKKKNALRRFPYTDYKYREVIQNSKLESQFGHWSAEQQPLPIRSIY